MHSRQALLAYLCNTSWWHSWAWDRGRGAGVLTTEVNKVIFDLMTKKNTPHAGCNGNT